MKRLLILLVLLGLGACGEKVETASSPAPPVQAPAGKGAPVPALSMQTPDGAKVEVKPNGTAALTLVEVWSPTWFEGSEEQFAGLQEIHERWGNRGVRVVCVAYDVATGTVKEAVERHGALFDVGLGEPAVYDALAVEALPTTWILDRQGRVVSKLEGYQPVSTLERELERLLSPD